MTDQLRAAAEAAIGAMVRAAITGHTDALDGYAEQLRAALAEPEPLHKGCAECCDADPGLALYCWRCIDKMAEQEPCDMGDICIGCTPRRSDGGCPGEQKPAAWIRDDTAITTDAYQAACWRDSHTVTPLYTTPPSREWKGLTDEEREVVMRRRLREHVMRTVEAMLKRKNT